MKNILISGYYGYNNTGDEAMVETMSYLLAKKNHRLIVLSANPEKTKELYNVEAYHRYRLRELVKAMKSADLVISGGGTLFQDVTSKKSLFYYIGVVRLAQLFHKKICIAYQGMGPLTSGWSRWITKNTLNKKSVKMVALRDEQAMDFAKEIGVKKEKISFSSDMIFMLEPSAQERCEKILKDNIHGYQKEEILIGVSLREWKDNDKTDLFAQMADQLVEKYHARIIFFPFHKPKDAETSKMVIQKMQHSAKAVLMPNRYLPSEILGTMGRMDLNIGVRLHSLVFSAMMNVPTLGISYDPKIDGFLDMIHQQPICTYEALDVDKIVAEAGKLLGKEEDNSFQITEFKKVGMEALDKILEEIK